MVRLLLPFALLLALATLVLGAVAGAAVPEATPSIDLHTDFQLRVEGARGLGIGSTVSAGDVNGDGVPDALVTQPTAPQRASTVYIVYGRRAWRLAVPLARIAASQGYRVTSTFAAPHGIAITNAGDVNGDGVPDALMGFPSGAGRVYVVFGQRSNPVAIDLNALSPSQGYVIEGAPGDEAGTAVANVGDVNGDGVPDAAISAPQGSLMPGRVYVVYGRRAVSPETIQLATLTLSQGYTIVGAQYDELGSALAPAGDVNGDGVPDALIGAEAADHGLPNSGSAYVVYGQRSATPASIDLSALGSWGYRVDGPVTYALAGSSLDNAGDVNGDGIADALVGAPGCNASQLFGSAYVVYGRPRPSTQPIELGHLGREDGYQIADTARGSCAGISVAGLGDTTGDGVPDAIVGAIGATWNRGSGAAYVVYGQRSPHPVRADLAHLAPSEGYVIGGIAGAETGWGVANAGDVDGDGASEAWVWAPNFAPARGAFGADYLVGRPLPAASARTASALVQRSRSVAIRIRCVAAIGASCSGTLVLRARSTTLGSASFSIAANAEAVVVVRLTPRAAALVRRTRTVRALARATTQQRAQIRPVVRSRIVVLRWRGSR
ncbi:MAG: integrin alpha [Actinomycetota bacterium]|nr:integrin alpha [Actinomycetota bacterium]